MEIAFLILVGAGIVTTIIGLVSLGVLRSRREGEAEATRKLATYRRRILLGMLESRSASRH